MPTTNTSFSSLITAIDTRAQTLASNGEAKDLVYLGKAIEAMNIPDSVSAIIDEGTTQVSNVQTEGATQVAAVQAAAVGYAPLAGATFTGAVTIPDLTVTGTTTTINSTNLEVADANITVASGATTSASADGAGITIDGASVNFQYSDSGKHMSLNTGLAVEEIKEKVSVSSQTSGTATVFATDQGVLFYNVDQLANRTINITGGSGITLDSILDAGQSYTVAVMMAQGSTAYYLDNYQVDGTAVTPKWQGGSAPTGGNASGIDVYTFTIIKTAANTFTVLASQTQFA